MWYEKSLKKLSYTSCCAVSRRALKIRSRQIAHAKLRMTRALSCPSGHGSDVGPIWTRPRVEVRTLAFWGGGGAGVVSTHLNVVDVSRVFFETIFLRARRVSRDVNAKNPGQKFPPLYRLARIRAFRGVRVFFFGFFLFAAHPRDVWRLMVRRNPKSVQGHGTRGQRSVVAIHI